MIKIFFKKRNQHKEEVRKAFRREKEREYNRTLKEFQREANQELINYKKWEKKYKKGLLDY